RRTSADRAAGTAGRRRFSGARERDARAPRPFVRAGTWASRSATEGPSTERHAVASLARPRVTSRRSARVVVTPIRGNRRGTRLAKARSRHAITCPTDDAPASHPAAAPGPLCRLRSLLRDRTEPVSGVWQRNMVAAFPFHRQLLGEGDRAFRARARRGGARHLDGPGRAPSPVDRVAAAAQAVPDAAA